MIDLGNIPYEQLLTTLKPVAVFLVTYCFLWTFLGILFRGERRARLLVSVIIALYSTNLLMANWDRTLGMVMSAVSSSIAKHILSMREKVGQSGK